MPKIGAEPIRRAALIQAAIKSIGRAGTLDVTVAQIAREAGMSSALAHHYFGSKHQIFLAAMRQILSNYRDAVGAALKKAHTPDERLAAIVKASFASPNFERETVAAWLNFYVLALVEPEAARLLRVYRRRLSSNLLVALRPRLGEEAVNVAETTGALIDGVYLRTALGDDPDAVAATGRINDYLAHALK